MPAPFYYDYRNVANSVITPSTIKVRNTAIAHFYKRYLLQKAISVYDFTFPEWWDKNYTLYCLYTFGWFCVFKTDRFGVIPQQCGLSGYNIFYRPRRCIVSNPLIDTSICLDIGVNCELVKLMPDYGNILQIVDKYGDEMALASQSVDISMLNSHVAYMAAAKTKAAAQTLKSMGDDVAAGKPLVIYDKLLEGDDGLSIELFNRDVKSSFIANDLLVTLQTLDRLFCTEIGIPNANLEKKERMITDEATANNIETFSKAQLWFDEINDGLERVRKMFGFSESELSCKWRNPPQTGREGGVDSGAGDSFDSGNV